MELDDATIRDLINLEDERGVLSFYVGHTPEQAADPQPTSPIEIRNQIKQLTATLEDRDADLARAVSRRMGKISGELDLLLDGKSHGRGRALFVGVDTGVSETVRLQIPFRDRVVHHDSAYVRPLVAALDEGRAAGVLVVSRAGAKVLRWSFGRVEQLSERSFELSDAQTADVKSGPSPGMPQHPGRGFVAKERFEDRIDDNHHRFLRDVVDEVVTEAKGRGWDRLVLSGVPKVRDEVRPLLPADRELRVIVADQAWEDVNPNVLADQLWPLMRSVHDERERDLTEQAVERALGGKAGAVGLRHVCDALNEGRVAHLLFDNELHLEGYRSEEDTVHPRVEGVVAQSDVPLHREPLFVERMIEKAIATNARVTPIDEHASQALVDHEGVAALLRW